MPPDPAADEAHRFLRAHTRGDLRFDEHLRPIRYVIGPDGRLAAPLMSAMLTALDTVLFVPAFAEGAMEVQVTIEPLDPDGPHAALTDRWRIYHGQPRDLYWGLLDVDAARYRQWVVDGPGLVRPNPLAADEPRLCRQINEGGAPGLAAACRRAAGADAEEPLLVGIDPLGFDVRRRFDVVRLPAPEPMSTPDDVQRVWSLISRQAADG